MEPVTKNMLIGAFATGAVDAGIEGYFTYMGGQGKDLRNTFPYIEFTPYLPPVDDWLAEAGVPLLLYVLGKGMKKDSLVQMAKGGAIYGVSQLAGITLIRVAKQFAPPTAARYVLVPNRRL
jgi:hypothetical protein